MILCLKDPKNFISVVIYKINTINGPIKEKCYPNSFIKTKKRKKKEGIKEGLHININREFKKDLYNESNC